MSCKLSDKCDNGKICKYANNDSYDILGGSCYLPKKPQTNEEWLRKASIEQLADWIVDITQYCFECGIDTKNCRNCPFEKCVDKGRMVKWLKQQHIEK